MLSLYALAFNATREPAFIPTERLTISWKLDSDREGVCQTAYRITVTETGKDVPAYDTGVVASAQSVHIPLATALRTRTAYTVAVTVTDNHGETATLSHTVGTAISPDEWGAQWIKPRRHIEGWSPYLRTKFETAPGLTSATLYVCGLGCGEYYINGQKIADAYIDPPISNYERTVYYRIYDVTDYIGEKNALTAWLGEGWYSQSRVWGSHGMKYGDCCLIARLELDYADGHRQVITTNTTDWTYKYSPITLNSLYGGETYDCRLETPDFASYDGDEEDWGSVIEDTTPRGTLTFCEMEPVRVIRTLPARSVKQASGKSDGAWIVDFGENVAGIVRLQIRNSPRGAQYVLRFAETVNPDGTLDYRSSGSFATQCIQQDVYIARGDAEGEMWTPRFTYHGFRYMEITGYHDLRAYGTDPELSIGECLVLSTDLRQTGSVQTACEDLNHLQSVMMSTFRSNYHGIPEDCPVREKCGWLGDAQVVCNTGMMNFDVEAAYTKYLHDMRTSDEVYGVWQMIAPGKRGCGEASPLWGCANVILPYYMYRYYGNEAVVRDNWDMMEKWVRHEIADGERCAAETGSPYIITRGLGDWCPPGGNGASNERRMPVAESSTAMFYEICIRMDELARALSLPCTVEYAALAAKIKVAFNARFWLPEWHRYGTWGTCGVALSTGLYPDGEKENLTAALLDLMAADDYAMPTGIYCNKYLVPALCESGNGDLALRYLFNRAHTSFATMLDDDATSLWEELEMKMIGQPRHKGTASYNHPMHAGFAYFLYAHVGGIKPLAPGFAEFAVEPCSFAGIPSASVSHDSPYGEIKVSYTRTGTVTDYCITVPANTRAHFMGELLPAGEHIRSISAIF